MVSWHLYSTLSITLNGQYVINVVASFSFNTCVVYNEWFHVNNAKYIMETWVQSGVVCHHFLLWLPCCVIIPLHVEFSGSLDAFVHVAVCLWERWVPLFRFYPRSTSWVLALQFTVMFWVVVPLLCVASCMCAWSYGSHGQGGTQWHENSWFKP